MSNTACIIVTYNGDKWIKKCLDSLLESALIPDIYIIDNGSSDNTIEIVKTYNKVYLFVNEENVGFGKANNQMLQKTITQKNYEYFFLINQDAWVEKDCIEKLINFINKNNDFGIVSPVHYNKDFTEVDFNFSAYLNKVKYTSSKEIVEVPFVNAAVWMVSRKCLEITGGFNSYFKHYGEDNNYCDRVKYKGLKIGVLTTTKANHDREKTTDFKKVIRLSEIRLQCIVLNPNYSRFKAFLKAFIHVLGIPKYYIGKLKLDQIIKLFLKLEKEYFRLLFSTEVQKNIQEQKKGLFLFK